MKKLANLKGAKVLSRKEQQRIHGDGGQWTHKCCDPELTCCNINPDFNGSNCQFIPGPPCF